MKNASRTELNAHGRHFGYGDVYYQLDDIGLIQDDDMAEAVCDGAFDAYQIARPHIQRTMDAVSPQLLFEDGSTWDEIFQAVSRIAYERGFLAGRKFKKR